MSARPGRDEFRRLAAEHTIVPVWKEVLADFQTPVAAFLRLDPSPNGFLLESVEGGERWARYSFIGGDAFAVVKAKEQSISIEGDPPVAPRDGEPPLAYVRRLLESCRAPALPGLPPLHGGAVGYLGYDCVRELERLPNAPPDDLGLPDLALILTRTIVVFDHLLQRAFVITNVSHPADPDAAYGDAVDRCDAVIERLAEPLAAPPIDAAATRRDVEFASDVGDREYEEWVVRAKERIFAGDIFQVVPSRRFEMPLDGTAFGAYRVLRTLNPSPYMYFLRFGEGVEDPAFEIAGSSPEPLVRVTGTRVISRPIAGTRPRGATEDEDLALEEELLHDDKERAEHVMLVDLARNDVGRVSAWGSVNVDELMVVERYSHVMHIVSSVSGILAPGCSPFDALTASFPAGTVTGAPKVRAMELIDGFEKTKRGPYAGVVGYFDFSGNLDTCITIRTIVATGGKAYVQAGAGVVADSIPDVEGEETRRKAEALLRAAAGAAALPRHV
ncbi:MAG TPA: anthranilate synthase component I [Actinomycetota bacterium]|nr:anthranilate synthase component I [Actinomycetota bacterium]